MQQDRRFGGQSLNQTSQIPAIFAAGFDLAAVALRDGGHQIGDPVRPAVEIIFRAAKNDLIGIRFIHRRKDQSRIVQLVPKSLVDREIVPVPARSPGGV